jgi:predicted transposase YbfD/YdcC
LRPKRLWWSGSARGQEKTAIPELLATLALDGCIVTIDAMGTQPNIAHAIRKRSADLFTTERTIRRKATSTDRHTSISR